MRGKPSYQTSNFFSILYSLETQTERQHFPGGVDFRDKFKFFQILLHTIVVLFSSGVDTTMKTAEVHDWGSFLFYQRKRNNQFIYASKPAHILLHYWVISTTELNIYCEIYKQ